MRQDQTVLLPFARDIGDAGADGFLGRVDRDGLSLDLDAAARDLMHAEDALHQLGPSGAHQAEDAEHLALAQAKADVLDLFDAQVLHLHERLADGDVARREHRADIAADHQADQLLPRGLRRGQIVDVFSVAHDHHAVGDLEDLLHAVRDINDRDLLRGELADDAEQVLRLLLVERGGRLVHDQNADVPGDRLGYFNQLLFRNGKLPDSGERVVMQTHPFKKRAAVLMQTGIIDFIQQAVLRQTADKDVFRNAQIVEIIQLLIHDADACVKRLSGV